jgi:penicillin-binding protein 1C
MVISRRQPGSALKPFLYALAFDRGLTPASVLADVPRSFTTLAGIYRPRNYDRLFHGPVRAREALASSYNVPAVDLVDRLGLTSFLATLHLAGFESLEQSAEHYGVGLALGNGDVTLLELANAYRALALGGVWRPYRWRAAADDAAGPGDGAGRRFVSARAATTVLDILSDPVARIPGFGVNTVLDFPFPVAAKTGTSRRFTDNWAVGVTGTFTVAVWTGNFSGRPMAAVSGITGAGPLLQRAVLLVARRYPPGTLTTPAEAGNVAAEICRVSGLAPGRDCPRAVEWFAPGSEPRRACDWHRDGQLVLPAEYAEWLGQRLEADGEGPGPDAGAVTLASTAVSEPVAPPPPAPPAARFRIVTPQDGDVYGRVPGVDPRYSTIALRAVGALDAGPVRWWVDGVEMRTSRWRLEPGRHTVRAAAASGEWDEVTITVEPN